MFVSGEVEKTVMEFCECIQSGLDNFCFNAGIQRLSLREVQFPNCFHPFWEENAMKPVSALRQVRSQSFLDSREIQEEKSLLGTTHI